jgi:opacity protein-like surface antigen
MSKLIQAIVARTALVIFLVIGGAAELRAQSYISPLIGFDFGGDSGCPSITGCEDKRMNVGVGLGRLGTVLGFETEFGYARDFFGSAPGLSSSVLTVMGSAMLVPNLGPIRPYGLIGLGIMRSHVDFTTASLLSVDNTDFGWDIGGGVFIFLGDHVGVRGDIRHFHSFQGLTVGPILVGDNKLDFGRASGALVLAF